MKPCPIEITVTSVVCLCKTRTTSAYPKYDPEKNTIPTNFS